MASKQLKVKAITQSYVGNKRRKIGQIFQVKRSDFSPNSMELLEGQLDDEQLARFKKLKVDSAKLKPKAIEVESDEMIEDEDDSAPEAPVPADPLKKSTSDVDVI